MEVTPAQTSSWIDYKSLKLFSPKSVIKRFFLFFDTQYFQETKPQAELGIRAWALIHNFAPSTAVTIRKSGGWQSPAERINQHRYHKNWLHNLLVSAHRAERKRPPPNPL